MDLKPKIDFSRGSPARKKISEEFYKPRWTLFRKWFFKNFDKNEQHAFSEEFYKDLEKHNKLISFVLWFMAKYVFNTIAVMERQFEMANGKIIDAVLPPQQPFKIKKLDFAAFATMLDEQTLQVTVSHINTMLKQQNYTNIYVHILGEQIISLQEKVDKLLSIISSNTASTSGKEKMEEPQRVAIPTIQPPPDVGHFKIKPDSSDLTKILNEKFKELSLKPLTKTGDSDIESYDDFHLPE